MTKVAFIGLGVMGYPMAGHLAAGGHEVTVYNRTTAKAEAWVKQHGGALAKAPREAVEGAEIAFSCVGNDDDLRGVVLGDNGIFAGLASGSIYVDNTTASATVARELHGIGKEQGIDVIDGFLSEVNVTSPTGLRQVGHLSGTRPDLAFVTWLERAVGGT